MGQWTESRTKLFLSVMYRHQNCLELTWCLSFIYKSLVWYWTYLVLSEHMAMQYVIENNAVRKERDTEQILH